MRLARSFFLLTVLAFCVLGAPPASTTLTVYLLDIETNITGAFANVAPAMTSALETAFLERRTFQMLDRRNLNDIVKANQLEKDIRALAQSGQVSQRLIQQVKGADGFIHSELVSDADGVVLTVTLTRLNSQIVWKSQSGAHTLAQWQLRETQKQEAEALAAKADMFFTPPSQPNPVSPPRGTTKIVPLDLPYKSTTVPSGTPLLIRIPLDSPPGMILDQPSFSASLEDPGPQAAIATDTRKSGSFFEILVPPLSPGSELDLTLAFEGKLDQSYLNELSKKTSADEARFKQAVSFAIGCGDFDCAQLEKAFREPSMKYRRSGLLMTALSALLAASPKEFSLSIGGKDYRAGTALDATDLPVAPEQEKLLDNLVEVWQNRAGYGSAAAANASQRLAARDRTDGFRQLFDTLSDYRARLRYLVSVSVSAK